MSSANDDETVHHGVIDPEEKLRAHSSDGRKVLAENFIILTCFTKTVVHAGGGTFGL